MTSGITLRGKCGKHTGKGLGPRDDRREAETRAINVSWHEDPAEQMRLLCLFLPQSQRAYHAKFNRTGFIKYVIFRDEVVPLTSKGYSLNWFSSSRRKLSCLPQGLPEICKIPGRLRSSLRVAREVKRSQRNYTQLSVSSYKGQDK